MPIEIGSRVAAMEDERLAGVLECYEFSVGRGRLFVLTDKGPGYWFHAFQVREVTPASERV